MSKVTNTKKFKIDDRVQLLFDFFLNEKRRKFTEEAELEIFLKIFMISGV